MDDGQVSGDRSYSLLGVAVIVGVKAGQAASWILVSHEDFKMPWSDNLFQMSVAVSRYSLVPLRPNNQIEHK